MPRETDVHPAYALILAWRPFKASQFGNKLHNLCYPYLL